MGSYQEPLYTRLKLLTAFYISSTPTFIFLLRSLQLVRTKKRQGRRGGGRKDGGKWKQMCCWPGRFLFCVPPQPHSSCPDANGCSTLLPSLHTHYDPSEPPPPLSLLLFLTRLAGNLTQKLVETNYSNDSCCPPANICHHYSCPVVAPNGYASGLANCCSPSLNRDWVGGGGSEEVFAVITSHLIVNLFKLK